MNGSASDNRGIKTYLFLWLAGRRTQIKFRAVNGPISKAPISSLPLERHLREHRLVPIDIVVNDNIAFRGVQAVQPAGILSKDSAPRNRHGQDQGIEPRVIEALTEIATRRHQHPFLASWNCGQGFGRPPRLPSAHAAMENDDVLRELQQAI